MPGKDRPSVFRSNGCEIDLARRELRVQGAAMPLGSRAFEILELLVQSAGELVSKGELISRVWPGAIVEDNALQFHVSAIRKALGPHRELLKTVSGRGYRLLGDWTVHQPGAAENLPLPTGGDRARPGPSNLPETENGLVGRSVALQQLQDLLSAHRVVTLTGPGGLGKSRLALELARRLLPSFAADASPPALSPLPNPH